MKDRNVYCVFKKVHQGMISHSILLRIYQYKKAAYNLATKLVKQEINKKNLGFDDPINEYSVQKFPVFINKE